MQAPPPSVGHLKPFVGGRVFALQPDVLRNRLIRYIPTTRNEVATSPQMAEAPNQVGQPKATVLLRNPVVPLLTVSLLNRAVHNRVVHYFANTPYNGRTSARLTARGGGLPM